MSDEQDRRLAAATERMKLIRDFGERVRELRERQGLSHEQLAQRCRLDPSVLSAMELGHGDPGLLTSLIVAQGLGMTASELLRETEAPRERAPKLSGR
jgi:transcriptional regulator with XRE-family HTH domain